MEISNLPSGTVTFLFTDIEGSTKLAQEHPNKWEDLRARHHEILQFAMDMHNGYVFQIIGDAFCVAFHTAGDSLNASVDAQRKLQNEDWGSTPIKVRMGIHTGEAERRETDYRGYLTMARVQRVMSVAYGNQILLSNGCREAIEILPTEVALRDMQEHRLKGFFDLERLWQVNAPGLQQDFPPLLSQNTIPNNLPAEVNRFIGREKEIQEIKERFIEHTTSERLLTLTGPGGAGKTRLSLQVAANILKHFKHGVWFVELASIQDSKLVAQAISKTINLSDVPGKTATEVLIEYLKNKELLLVLDNFEQVVEAASLIKEILSAAQQVKVLVTSRIVLRIAGEWEYVLPLLSLPERMQSIHDALTSESMCLFMERAQSVRSDFQLTTENVNILVEICHRLEGLPLAIELAASNIRFLSVNAILSQLDHRINSLKSRARDLAPRQQTLRSAIDWSHELLTPEEQIVFRRFSVFVEGVSLETVEEVCNLENFDAFALIDSLIGKSLLKSNEMNGKYRFSMLGIIKEYAAEKLDAAHEADVVSARHLEYFRKRAETVEPELLKPNQVRWLDELEIELGDLRAAIHWGINNTKTESLLRLAGALCFFWQRRGHLNEGIEYLECATTAAGAESHINKFIKALNRLGVLYFTRGEYQSATSKFERVILLARKHNDQAELGHGLVWRCSSLMRQQQFESAIASASEGLVLFKTLGEKWGQGLAHFFFGRIELESGQSSTAETHFKQSVLDFQESGDLWGRALSSNSLGSLYLQMGQLKSAQVECEKSLVLREQMKDYWGINSCYLNLGDIARLQGEVSLEVYYYRQSYELGMELGLKGDMARAANCLGFAGLHNNNIQEAEFYFEKSLKTYLETNNERGIFECIAGYAGVSVKKEQFEYATKLLAATDAMLKASGIKMWRVDQLDFDKYQTILREQLNETEFQNAWKQGYALTMEQTLDLVKTTL